MALIGGSQTKEGEGRVQKPLFNNHSITAKESWQYPMCSFNFCWGCVGDTLARRMPYEMLVPRCKGILQRVNFHFIRALCAPSVSPCGSCGTVMDGHGHLHTVISKEFCWRAFARSMLMSHSPMGRHKLVCFCLPCALCFLSLCTLKSWETKAEAWRRCWNAACTAAHEETSPLRWKQPRLKCAHSCLHKKHCKERLSDNRKIHTQVKNWRNMYENEQPLTEKHWTASKMEKKYKPKSRKWQNLLRTSTALKVKRQMLSDLFSSLFPCGAHSARIGQGQTSELRVPGCAACSGMWAFIYGCASCTFSLGL